MFLTWKGRYKAMGINLKKLKYVLLLIPYFEIYTISMMVDRDFYPEIFKILGYVFALTRTVISFEFIMRYFIIYRLYTLKRKKMMSVVILFCGTLGIISILNGSAYLMFFLGLFNYIGLVSMCSIVLKEDKIIFLKSLMLLFGTLSMIGIISIFLFPSGFFFADITDYAVYFLGGKNSAIYYFLMFLMLLLIVDKKEKIINIDWIFPFILFLMYVAILIVRSSNSLICLIAVTIYYFFIHCNEKIRKILTPRLLFFLLFVIILIIIFANEMPLIVAVLKLFGKSTNYTGRTILWEQAIDMISAHPIIGNGVESTFTMMSGGEQIVYPQAHNFYLDVIAKYGFFPLVILMGGYYYLLKKAWKVNKDSGILGIVMFFLSIYLFHSIFDDISLYYFMLFFCLITCDIDENVEL